MSAIPQERWSSSGARRTSSAKPPSDTLSNAAIRRNLAIADSAVSDVLLALNRRDEALATQQAALATFEALAAADPANVTGRNDIAISESKIGEILDGGGRSSEAVKSYDERALLLLTRRWLHRIRATTP